MFEILYRVWNYFEFCTSILTSTANIFNTFLTVSIWLGKIIVDCVTRFSAATYKSLCSVISGFTIMCEDFTYFLRDLENIFCHISAFIEYVWDFLTSSITSLFSSCLNFVQAVIYFFVYVKDAIHGTYRYGLKTIYDFLVTFKGAIILIGNIIWTFVALIPAIFIYLISIFVFFINRSAEEVRTIVSSIFYGFISLCSETYLFIIDTPIESVCGLLIGFILVYIMRKHKNVLINFAFKSFKKLYDYILTRFLQLFVFVISYICFFFLKLRSVCYNLKIALFHIIRRDATVPVCVAETQHNCVNERLCVICKDSESNVVIIPCKHMCLCEVCSNYDIFRRYQSSCPVCRRHIDRLLKVYF